MSPHGQQSPEGLSNTDLLDAIATEGGHLLQSARKRLADAGPMPDDERWSAPIPIRYELQQALMFLGALDAYDVATGLLRARASQQAFGCMRFQMETLAVVRWMAEPVDQGERQHRAYRIACGLLARWAKLMMADAGRDREALEPVHAFRDWGRQLQAIAAQDGIQQLRQAPDRGYLLPRHGPDGGSPIFAMLSELGSHPGAVGNLLFSIGDVPGLISYSLEGAHADRAYYCSTSLMFMWQTCEAVAATMSWSEWLDREARGLYESVLPLMAESIDRHRRNTGAPADQTAVEQE